MFIGSLNLNEAVSRITEHIAWMTSTFPEFPKEQQGGYLYHARKSDGLMLATIYVGECPFEKAKQYQKFAQEKANRLHHYIGLAEHISSWQSRMVALERYGGAIVAGDNILSFSGLPEHKDESTMLDLALVAGLISWKEATVILDISQNPWFPLRNQK